MVDDIRTHPRYAQPMAELRTEKVSVILTPTVLARLDAYRDRRRWSRSTAIAALVEDGLDREEREASS
jgi:metal-responsive CopG/Arc/MetJ family transcriptional regulator